MFEAVKNSYMVPCNGTFRRKNALTSPPSALRDRKANKSALRSAIEELDDLQRVLYAHNRYALLLVFQAMDAAGKDSTIRAVLSGVNPAGCQVFSFKQPTPEELDHDFLWRTTCRLPERGRIGIFNRSYYEEVLVVRVHPEFLAGQRLPYQVDLVDLWKQRYKSIRDQEEHLARNGTVILKFWLNVSRDEQLNRFLSRIDEPEKNWKFSESDVRERSHWNNYMAAYEEALNETSRPWAPWYAIPADDKPYMRRRVAEIIVQNLKTLDMGYPVVDEKRLDEFRELRGLLEND